MTSSSVKGKMGPSFTVLEKTERHRNCVYRDIVNDKVFNYQEMMKLQVICRKSTVTTFTFLFFTKNSSHCLFIAKQLQNNISGNFLQPFSIFRLKKWIITHRCNISVMNFNMCLGFLYLVLQVLSGQRATRSITVRQRGVWDLISAQGPAEMTDPVNITPAKPQTSCSVKRPA